MSEDTMNDVPDRAASEPDRGPSGPIRFQRNAIHDRGAAWIAGLLVALVALVVAKPWSTSPPPPSTAIVEPSGQAKAVLPLPSTAGPLAPSDDACGTSMWWATVVEGSPGHEVRSWFRVEPSTAASELDAAIPTAQVFAAAPRALGFCVGSIDGRRGISAVQAWRIDAGVPSEIPLQRVAAASPTDPAAGSLYAPPGSGSLTVPPFWAPGRYVFEVRFAQPASSGWFAVDMVKAREASLEIGSDVTWPGSTLGPSGRPSRSKPATP